MSGPRPCDVDALRDFLSDHAATCRAEAKGVVGGQMARLYNEADDCERWATMVQDNPPRYSIRPQDLAAYACKEGCDEARPVIGGCERCGRPAFTDCLRFHAGMVGDRWPVTADFLTFAADMLDERTRRASPIPGQ